MLECVCTVMRPFKAITYNYFHNTVMLNENNYQNNLIRCSILNEVGPLNCRSIEDCMHGLVQHYLHNDNGEIYHRNE